MPTTRHSTPGARDRHSLGHSNHARDIPTVPVYVTMTDRFMGGWGPAQGRSNRHVILCDDWTTAGLVGEAATTRPEMSRVSISADRPRQRAYTLFSWSAPDGWIKDQPDCHRYPCQFDMEPCERGECQGWQEV